MDVNITLGLFRLAYLDQYDRACNHFRGHRSNTSHQDSKKHVSPKTNRCHDADREIIGRPPKTGGF
jgi:hypothetical protein